MPETDGFSLNRDTILEINSSSAGNGMVWLYRSIGVYSLALSCSSLCMFYRGMRLDLRTLNRVRFFIYWHVLC